MVDAKTVAEGTAIVVLVNFRLIGYIAVLDSLMFNMDTTEEIAFVGGQKAVQDPVNCTYD